MGLGPGGTERARAADRSAPRDRADGARREHGAHDPGEGSLRQEKRRFEAPSGNENVWASGPMVSADSVLTESGVPTAWTRQECLRRRRGLFRFSKLPHTQPKHACSETVWIPRYNDSLSVRRATSNEKQSIALFGYTLRMLGTPEMVDLNFKIRERDFALARGEP